MTTETNESSSASAPPADGQNARSARPLPFSAVDRWDMETDVAVVGLGGAGSCAAIEAADAGARVTVFEAASGASGSTAMSSAIIYMGGNGGTPAQKANGFNDDTEDMFRYLMMASGPNADEQKVRLYAESSLQHFYWLQSMGVEFKDTFTPGKIIHHLTDDCLLYTGNEDVHPFDAEAKPCPRGHQPRADGDRGGAYLIECLTKAAEKRGVRIEYDARALRLIQDDQGRVRGLEARVGGEVQRVRARCGVVLCAGGFVMNHDMVRRHAPALLRNGEENVHGNPNDDGSGIRMGMGAGGAAINMNEGFVSLPFYPPSDFVKGALINAQGQRFINEDSYHGRVGYFCLRQVGDAIYLVVDNDLYQKPNEYIDPPVAGTGETVEELERELKLPEGSLQASIEVYNRHAARGEDPLFHKKAEYLKPLDQPPYAAFDCSIGKTFYPYFTFGGLHTRTSGEVLDAGGQPVVGLYAAGRTACGLPRSGAGYSSGMSVGDATFFGRMAGQTAGRAAPDPD